MAFKDRGTEALGRFRGNFGATCSPQTRRGLSLGIWRVPGRLCSQSCPGHALQLRAAPTDCTQSSHRLGPRPRLGDSPRAASWSRGTRLLDRHMPLAVRGRERTRPGFQQAAPRKLASPSLPHSEDTAGQTGGDSTSHWETGPRLPASPTKPGSVSRSRKRCRRAGAASPLLPALVAMKGSLVKTAFSLEAWRRESGPHPQSPARAPGREPLAGIPH